MLAHLLLAAILEKFLERIDAEQAIPSYAAKIPLVCEGIIGKQRTDEVMLVLRAQRKLIENLLQIVFSLKGKRAHFGQNIALALIQEIQRNWNAPNRFRRLFQVAFIEGRHVQIRLAQQAAGSACNIGRLLIKKQIGILHAQVIHRGVGKCGAKRQFFLIAQVLLGQQIDIGNAACNIDIFQGIFASKPFQASFFWPREQLFKNLFAFGHRGYQLYLPQLG